MRSSTSLKLFGLISLLFAVGVVWGANNFPNLMTDQIHISGATATTVPTFDANKKLVSSTVTPTQLLLLSSATNANTASTLVLRDTGGALNGPIINGADLVFGSMSNTNLIQLPNGSTTALAALTRNAGNIAYDTTQNLLVFDNGSSMQPVGAPIAAATASVLGTVKSTTTASHQWLTGLSTGTGVFTQSQPAFSDISGSVASTQLPTPTASTLGGVESLTAVTHNFLTSISTSGVPTQAQPAFSDISGTASLTSQVTGILPAANGGTGQNSLTSLTLPTPATDIVTFTTQASTPASSSAGSLKFYSDTTTGKFRFENSSGNIFKVGMTWIVNYAIDLFDGTTAGTIATYNDSSTTAPVDGTGGTVAGLTTTINTSSPIQNPSNIRFNKDAANRQGEGWSWDFTLERADYESGRPVPITFMQKSSTNYVAGDLTMFVYDISGSALVSSTGIPCLSNASGVSALAATSTTAPVTCYFQPVNQTDTNYRVIWHVASTNANAWTFDIARLKVSPDEKLLVAPTGPTGEIIALGSSTTPANFLPADGTAVSRSTYAELFGVIGTTYGTGDGSTTFNVPNGSGVFLRGVGTQTISSIATPTIVLGTTSGDTMQGHVHTWTLDIGQITNGSGTSSASFNHTLALGGAGLNGTVSPSAPSTDGSHGTPRTASETAPANIGVKFYIRYTSQSNVLSSTAFTLQTPAPSDAISSIKTPTASGNWNAMTGNSITLTSGTWRLSGSCVFNNSGTTPAYTSYDCAWAGANGADSSTAPAALGTVAGLSVYTQLVEHYVAGTTASAAYPTAPVTLVKCASSCTIFLNTLNSMTTPANARVSVYPQYEKVPDFTVYGVTGKFEIQQTTSSIKTPTASGNFNAMTGNSITLSPGTWRLFGSCKFDSSGTASYTQYDCFWGAANGADGAVSPGGVSAVTGLTVISAYQIETYANFSTGVLAATFVPAQQVIVSCSQTCTVFLDTYNSMTTAANARVTAFLTGERLQ